VNISGYIVCSEGEQLPIQRLTELTTEFRNLGIFDIREDELTKYCELSRELDGSNIFKFKISQRLSKQQGR